MLIQHVGLQKSALSYIHHTLKQNGIKMGVRANGSTNNGDITAAITGELCWTNDLDYLLNKQKYLKNPFPQYDRSDLYYIIQYRHPIRALCWTYREWKHSTKRRKNHFVNTQSLESFAGRWLDYYKWFINKWLINFKPIHSKVLTLYLDNLVIKPHEFFKKISLFLNRPLEYSLKDIDTKDWDCSKWRWFNEEMLDHWESSVQIYLDIFNLPNWRESY